MRRWLNSDDRNKTILYITYIINKSFHIIDNICTTKDYKNNKNINNNSGNLQNILFELLSVKNGLNNLSETYYYYVSYIILDKQILFSTLKYLNRD